jgi:hypothetical protein
MTSKYCKEGYAVTYDKALAEQYQPIIYDPYGYGRDYNPTLYFRTVESDSTTNTVNTTITKTTRCIQYFYYWDKQDCKKDYVISEPNTVGSIVGIVFAILEYIAVNILGIYITQIFLVPWWAWWVQFLAAFFIGLLVGVKFHNSINDIKIFQQIAGFIVGRFFTHPYDFEPILVFVRNSEIIKAVISGRGDIDSEPHRNDIFAKQNYYSKGESIFYLEKTLLVKGKPMPLIPLPRVIFKEFEDSKLKYNEANNKDLNHHPKFAIITCYHAFTAEKEYYDEIVFKEKDAMSFSLEKLSDDLLDDWYEQKGFGHDVSDPFSFPYIRFVGEVNKGRPGVLALLEALSMVMKGLIALKESITSIRKNRITKSK